MGDAVLAHFGYPQAHEDDAERAIRAGLGVVAAIQALDETLGDKRGVEPAVRVGVATGPVVVGDPIGEGASQESAVVGETLNLAARLQGLASPDSVVIAPSTHGLAGAQFDYADLGIQQLKGIANPVQAWEVSGEMSVESRFAARRGGARLTPLVGRDEEIDFLSRRWEQAESGEGRVVLLVGDRRAT